MSWIIGCSGQANDEKKKQLLSFGQSSLFKIETNNLLLYSGGNSNTCFYSIEDKWLTSGFIIDKVSEKNTWLRKEQISKRLKLQNFNSLQGHFIISQWGENQINFISDSIGLRTIYFLETRDCIYFSTKLNWLASLLPAAELNLNEFGARWLTYNQWSHNSFVKNIFRLPPGSTAVIKDNKVTISKQNWLPVITEQNKDDLVEKTKSILNLQIPNEFKISLGLSGGLDSRFLLSILLNTENDFDIHTIGDELDPDVMIAKKITKTLGININWITSGNVNPGKLLSDLKQYASETEVIEPVSTYLKLKLFDDAYFQNKILVDGAMAEFARRQFLKKLRTIGRFYLLRKDAGSLLKFIRTNRPAIFKNEYMLQMIDSVSSQLENMFEEIGLSTQNVSLFADAMIAKYRLPNYFGPEQSRLDTILQSFMPFAQPDIISACLSIPDSHKKNNKLMYSVIKRFKPELSRIPLIKNGRTYPFGSSTLKATLFSKLGSKPKEEDKSKFFLDNKEFIRDHFNSKTVKNFELYDQISVNKIVSDFYSEEVQGNNDLNWLLSFEFFRLGLNLR